MEETILRLTDEELELLRGAWADYVITSSWHRTAPEREAMDAVTAKLGLTEELRT